MVRPYYATPSLSLSPIFFNILAATLKDARDIVLLSQKAKTVVAVNENWSYHPLICAVAEYVKNGGIGEVKKDKLL